MAKELLLFCISFIWEKEEIITTSCKPETSMDTLSLKSSGFPHLLHWTLHRNCWLLEDQDIQLGMLLVLMGC